MSDPTIEDLKIFVNGMLEVAKARFGERLAAIVMIGVPVDNGHDRFAANAIGPCLAARGLLDWGVPSVRRTIEAFYNPADPVTSLSNGGAGKGGTVIVMANKIIGGGTIGGVPPIVDTTEPKP